MLMLYCMTEPNANVAAPAAGVRGGKVTSIVEGEGESGVRCFYSDSDLSNSAQHTNQITVEAMEFDAVLREIFRQVAVIPFRFMTALAGVEELRGFLQRNAAEYSAELARIRDKIQMEVRITAKQAPAAVSESPTGTDFLKTRQAGSRAVEQVADQFTEAYPKAQWKRRATPDGMRLYALIDKVAGSAAGAEDFSQAIKSLAIPPEFLMRTSGPWPATEFINCYADLQTAVAGSKK